MASVILSTAGAAVGANIPVLGPMIGGAIGRMVGNTVGGLIDNAVFGVDTIRQEGARLSDLSVQVSTYGKVIPTVYGTMRLAGNVIWSRSIKETVVTTTSSSGGGKGGGGGGTRIATTNYSYSVSLAIALCEGEITEIVRVWADAKLLDVSQGRWRMHKGENTQTPDPFIESFEGVGKTPAYRGLAYVVIEDFPLEAFGNRTPNFTFEVRKAMRGADYQGKTAEEMVKSVMLIPGSGEFVYDTQVQTHVAGQVVAGAFVQNGWSEVINDHTTENKANVLVALDQMQKNLPNLEWVGVVVNWFGNSMDATSCTLMPCVEYAQGGISTPDAWSVAGLSRTTARPMILVDGSPRYGGTPDDSSIVRLLTELRARGLKIMLLPMPLMDVAGKPWRGYLTGSASSVSSFFSKAWGYNQFILHYAQLAQGKVDAFVIGSELVGLTKVSSSAGVYPAVNALVSLAASVRGILGSGVTLTYAADWSEYHHTDGGWYHMDALWASPNIDVIGIDAYFPLTNAPQSVLGYDVEAVKQGWVSGEGYDFYYTNSERTTTASLSPAYAWKNIAWFWNNTHTNPNGSVTAWVPRSKKIWFTEYGFPSVDGATNQPNVFYDPASSGSGFPYHSQGRIDFRAQRTGIIATEAQFATSDMVTRRFLWTWDARPYPYFPDLLSVWADGGAWAMGHWVTGKFGSSSLGAVVQAVCERAGLPAAMIDVSRLHDQVDGYAVTQQATAASLLQDLMNVYAFDAVESGGVLRFVPRGATPVVSIPRAELVALEGEPLMELVRVQDLALPKHISVVYLNKEQLYQPSTQTASRGDASTQDARTITVPLVMSDAQARATVELLLAQAWQSRTRYRFTLHRGYAQLEVCDVVQVDDGEAVHTLRITAMWQDKGLMKVEGVAVDASMYDPAPQPVRTTSTAISKTLIGDTRVNYLELPALPWDDATSASLRIACAGAAANWTGAAIYRSDDGGANYVRVAESSGAAMMGVAHTALPAFAGGNVVDEISTVDVVLHVDDALESITSLGLLNGGNLALIGDEVVQFQAAEELSAGLWRLRGLLRGRCGTAWAMATHSAGERFVLLDAHVTRLAMPDAMLGAPRSYKAVSYGQSLSGASAQTITLQGLALKPYAPVHGQRVRSSAGDAMLSWVRCSRLGADWRDYVDAPLNETSERYEVDIVNSSGAVVRTLTTTTPSVAYVAAQQIADLGSTTASFTARIYKMSEKVGRGYELAI